MDVTMRPKAANHNIKELKLLNKLALFYPDESNEG